MLPEVTCLHCGNGLTVTYADLDGDHHRPGDELSCDECDKSMYVHKLIVIDPEDPESDVVALLYTKGA